MRQTYEEDHFKISHALRRMVRRAERNNDKKLRRMFLKLLLRYQLLTLDRS